MPVDPEFGKLIRRLREEKKRTDPSFSLRRFAEAVGISATFISKMETGDYAPPSHEKIKRMAELLEYDPDELLALAGKIDPELNDIIRERSGVLPDILRSMRGMSEEDLRRLADQARKKEQKPKEE